MATCEKCGAIIPPPGHIQIVVPFAPQLAIPQNAFNKTAGVIRLEIPISKALLEMWLDGKTGKNVDKIIKDDITTSLDAAKHQAAHYEKGYSCGGYASGAAVEIAIDAGGDDADISGEHDS
jgi:hypothetical protein